MSCIIERRGGGGVCIYVEASITYEYVDDWSQSCKDIEVLCLKSENTLITVVYRPPHGSINNFFNFRDEYFRFLNENKYTLVLGGDLNIDMLISSNKQTEFSNMLLSYSLSIVIATPTRVTATTATLIDLFITNTVDILHHGTINVTINDHLPIYFITNVQTKQNHSEERYIYFQNINPRSLSWFREEIGLLSWNDILSCSSPEKAYDHFIDTLCSVYHKHFPYKLAKKPKQACKPGISFKLLQLIKKKNALYHSFVSTRDLDVLKEFKTFRNHLTKLLKQAKHEYYYSMFNSIVDAKKMWNKLNSVLS